MLPTIAVWKFQRTSPSHFSAFDNHQSLSTPRLWATSDPNTEDDINSSRNGTNDPTRETQTLNTCHFRQHDNNKNRLLLLTAEHFPLDWVGTLKHGASIIELFCPSYS
ncbi:hypothetical protein N7449_008085 [Penicillium cf. viridicatum]|uniref:Uncharacterized protein n=1 Tax=Penicillium cf. viridicatum TaxID=2972119 RepID=A0A9W9MC28_9EURO|nr:hypothetical protein N7449_008085 [Penicillium cf. viridicatum]